MINFEGFDPQQGVPIYIQIVLYIKRGIVAGKVLNDDELPSRRMLSTLLGVNPNTVQKAYRILEDEGLMVSYMGSKSLMILDDEKKRKVSQELLENDAKNIVLSMKQMGISKDTAISIIEKYWE